MLETSWIEINNFRNKYFLEINNFEDKLNSGDVLDRKPNG